MWMDPTGLIGVMIGVSHFVCSTDSRIPCTRSLSSFASNFRRSVNGTCHGYWYMGAIWGSRLKEIGILVYLSRPPANTLTNSLDNVSILVLLVLLIPLMTKSRDSNQSSPNRLGRELLTTISCSRTTKFLYSTWNLPLSRIEMLFRW